MPEGVGTSVVPPETPPDGRRGVSRRDLLRAAGGGALAVTGGWLLAACGSSAPSAAQASSAASASPAGLAKVALQFVFIKNVQFAGSFFAESNGYYKARGLDVTLLAGGPNTSVPPVVQSGQALVGISHTADAVQAILNGADLTIIGAGFQRNPFCVISRQSAPVSTPAALVGKKVGVQTHDLPVFRAFLQANHISESSLTLLPLQSDPTPLASGEMDAIMGFYTNEPITLQLKGTPTHEMLLGDFGYPLMEELYIVKSSSLADPATRKEIVGLMQGESLGWTDAVTHPSAAAALAVDDYGKDLHLSMRQQVLAMRAEVALVVTADTKAHGLFWMSDQNIAGTVRSLRLGGVQASPGMFTRSVLTEVYQGKAAV